MVTTISVSIQLFRVTFRYTRSMFLAILGSVSFLCRVLWASVSPEAREFADFRHPFDPNYEIRGSVTECM